MKPDSKKICVAMSGGVDSSVAAYLLQREGHILIGVTMCLGVADNEHNTVSCCGPSAIADARRVCDVLGIPHYVIDFSRKLNNDVIDDFIRQYSLGRTPNPCIRCNRYLKFTALSDYARSCGYDTIATGHYAGIGRWNGKSILMRHKDQNKDQSYFLYGIPPERIDGIVFPLSGYTKSEVRKIAYDAALPVASKPESQEICFIRDNDYRSFLRKMGFHESAGEFVDTSGKILGTHYGIYNYTIGQRKGLGVATGERRYVISIDAGNNRVVLGDRNQLLCSSLVAGELNMFVENLPEYCTAKVRYTQKEVGCKAEIIQGKLYVNFIEPVEAVAPGQSVVLYMENVVLGGGVIEKFTSLRR